MEKTAPTTSTKETIDVINDLVAINNDRIVGYEKALEEAEESVNGVKGSVSRKRAGL